VCKAIVFPSKYRGTAVALGSSGSPREVIMIWIVVVAMATVGLGWMKVRRNRKTAR
jgi:hypothetical protein